MGSTLKSIKVYKANFKARSKQNHFNFATSELKTHHRKAKEFELFLTSQPPTGSQRISLGQASEAFGNAHGRLWTFMGVKLQHFGSERDLYIELFLPRISGEQLYFACTALWLE